MQPMSTNMWGLYIRYYQTLFEKNVTQKNTSQLGQAIVWKTTNIHPKVLAKCDSTKIVAAQRVEEQLTEIEIKYKEG